jgi:hypothetical protein
MSKEKSGKLPAKAQEKSVIFVFNCNIYLGKETTKKNLIWSLLSLLKWIEENP